MDNLIGGTPYNCERCGMPSGFSMCHSCRNELTVLKSLPLVPKGFSEEKDSPNYWGDAYKDFWAETGLDTDCCDLAIIVAWFDKRRHE